MLHVSLSVNGRLFNCLLGSAILSNSVNKAKSPPFFSDVEYNNVLLVQQLKAACETVTVVCMCVTMSAWLRWLYEKTRLPLIPIYGGFPVKMMYVSCFILFHLI